jgi:hypothetical protein
MTAPSNGDRDSKFRCGPWILGRRVQGRPKTAGVHCVEMPIIAPGDSPLTTELKTENFLRPRIVTLFVTLRPLKPHPLA